VKYRSNMKGLARSSWRLRSAEGSGQSEPFPKSPKAKVRLWMGANAWGCRHGQEETREKGVNKHLWTALGEDLGLQSSIYSPNDPA
jgi:hypothetical protein